MLKDCLVAVVVVTLLGIHSVLPLALGRQHSQVQVGFCLPLVGSAGGGMGVHICGDLFHYGEFNKL